MTSNRVMLAKAAVTTADLATGGRLNPEQADRFIDYVVDQGVVLKEIDVQRMDAPQRDLDTIGIGSRIVRKATEAQEPTETVGIQTGKRTLQTTEIILPIDISLSFIEDNIEREDVEDHIARLAALQFGNDLEDLMINGDMAATGPDAPFLTIDNGILKILRTETGAHRFDTNASKDYKGVVFPGMLALLPDKFKRDLRALAFYVSPTDEEGYRNQLSTRETALGDQYLTTGRRAQFMGIDVEPVPYMPVGVYLLAVRQNLAVGIQRQITSDRERKPRKRVIELTMTARIDFNLKTLDAAVLGEEII